MSMPAVNGKTGLNGYDRSRLAALIDGDGGRIEIRVENNIYIRPILLVRNREPEVVSSLETKYGGKGRTTKQGVYTGRNIWRANAIEAIDLIKWVRPNLWSPIKQRQADLMIDLTPNEDGAYLTDIGDNLEIVEEMRKINPNSRPSSD